MAGLVGLGLSTAVQAVPAAQDKAAELKAPERSVDEWLARMQNATSRRSYAGTFVVSSAGSLFSSRIWHVCDGTQQYERVDSLTGVARSTFRRNDDVVSFLPASRVARIEKRESSGLFPHLNAVSDLASVADFYGAKAVAVDRAAGFDADVVQIQPKDRMRFGYLIWSERKTGLVIKTQTLDTDGRVIEQSAFSELQLDAPVKPEKLAQLMGQTEGYRVEKTEVTRTSAQAEGWQLRADLPGFKAISCVRRSGPGSPPPETVLQWIFSDGLASVSLFIEKFDPQRHLQESLRSMGATQTLTRRLHDGAGDWWLTLVGEVPVQTLLGFAQNLERKK